MAEENNSKEYTRTKIKVIFTLLGIMGLSLPYACLNPAGLAVIYYLPLGLSYHWGNTLSSTDGRNGWFDLIVGYLVFLVFFILAIKCRNTKIYRIILLLFTIIVTLNAIGCHEQVSRIRS